MKCTAVVNLVRACVSGRALHCLTHSHCTEHLRKPPPPLHAHQTLPCCSRLTIRLPIYNAPPLTHHALSVMKTNTGRHTVPTAHSPCIACEEGHWQAHPARAACVHSPVGKRVGQHVPPKGLQNSASRVIHHQAATPLGHSSSAWTCTHACRRRLSMSRCIA